jgi:heme/copper-type cytochrome/quinol oxidase subunit 1
MDWYVRAFIRSSVSWLTLGVTLGLVMTIWPRLTVYRTAHVHMLLLGFVAMMIFGFGYHVVPRLAGNRLYRPAWAGAHVFLANAGLAGLSLGLALRVHGVPAAGWVLATGGLLASVGAYAFAVNIALSTRKKRTDPAAAAAAVKGRRLPTLAED